MIEGGCFLTRSISPEDIFTPEDMSEDQKLLSRIVEEFLRGEVEPRIKELEAETEGLMPELLKKSSKVGFFGVDIPIEFSGMGMDFVSSLIVTEKSFIGGPFALVNLVNNTFGALPIMYFGNDEQKHRYLPNLANGTKIGAFALTEPDAGSDALSLKTTASLSTDGQYYILNGTKQFISNTGYADFFITYGKVDGQKFTAFIVDKNSDGLFLGEEEDKLGIRGTSTRSLTLDNVRVPLENLLFKVGLGHMVAFNTLNIGRYKLSGACIGMAKLAFDSSVRYAKNRLQFGQPISNFGLIKEKIGEMAIRIFVGESMVYRISNVLDQGIRHISGSSEPSDSDIAHRIEEYAGECSINKVYASELLDYIVDEAVQIHGGYGYIKDYPVERHYRDSRIYRIFGGTNEINRLLIFKMLLKKMQRDHLVSNSSMEAPDPIKGSDEETCPEGLDRLVDCAKKSVLFSLAAATQIHPEDLPNHQELMGLISNIIIEVFAMESCLVRAEKITKRLGTEKGEIPGAMCELYILDASMRIERWIKLIFSALFERDQLRIQLSHFKEFKEYLPVNSIDSRRKIADFMFKAGRYFIC